MPRYIHGNEGLNIAVGGFVNTRPPIAPVHEIIRQGAKDMTLSFQSGSICSELLAKATLLYPRQISIKGVELEWWGYEVIGIAPLSGYLISSGSDMELVNRGIMAESPFTGKNTYLGPACYPDVGLIHATAADRYGACRMFGALCICPENSMAAGHMIVTTEQVIPNENIGTYPNLTEIPYTAFDAVVSQRFGGYPGASC